MRTWAFLRRLQYVSGFLLIIGAIGLVTYYVNFYVPPNCFDGELNGEERGVDCGGGCTQICLADIMPPTVVWAESFEITPGQYNSVAYVENRNLESGTPELGYTFRLYSGDDLIGERTGVTALPPNSVYPVFEGRVFTEDAQSVTRTEIILENPDFWLPSTIGRNQFRTTDINLTRADDRPRLEVQLENTTLQSANDIDIVATIFNEAGDPVTSSQTFVESIEPRTTSNLVFTWPNPITKTVRNCIIPTDVAVVVDLSGSMNNDGDNPPEPVTSALGAASEFIGNLNENDQVSVVTFASEAMIQNPLTNQQRLVSNSIRSLEIDPAEESGFTNTFSALELADAELLSSRHNLDARRVVVLLTDGLPTAPDDEDILIQTISEADRIVAGGAEVYAIGLGNNVDSRFISDVASTNQNAYLAPTASDLSRIYAEITSSICEVGNTKIDVIAKTKANFAPIQ